MFQIVTVKLVEKYVGHNNLFKPHRILVCGDETQKPFPLLVWSLTSRKLLYDLRIQHHEFITSKAAITYEGNQQKYRKKSFCFTQENYILHLQHLEFHVENNADIFYPFHTSYLLALY